jgi:hypothetical protein
MAQYGPFRSYQKLDDLPIKNGDFPVRKLLTDQLDDRRHDALSTLVATLESQFGCLVGVNAYLTPGGAQGRGFSKAVARVDLWVT